MNLIKPYSTIQLLVAKAGKCLSFVQGGKFWRDCPGVRPLIYECQTPVPVSVRATWGATQVCA